MNTALAPLLPPMPPAPVPASEAPALTLSGADLAKELRVPQKTITRMDQSGKMPAAIRVGHAKRWLRSTILAWLADGCPSRRDWEAASLPLESSRHDSVGAPSATESRCNTVTAKATPVIQPVGPTPLLDLPRALELFRFILSKQTCERIFDAEYEYLMAGYQRARHPRYNTRWGRRWLNFAFAWRSVLLIARCCRPAIWAAAVAAILRFIPPQLKDWLFRLFR